MKEYMGTIAFPAVIDEEFISLVPRQRAMVNALMGKGVITSYSLSANRQTLWVTIMAESEDKVHATLKQMPLFPYMNIEVQELMFHNPPIIAQPSISLN